MGFINHNITGSDATEIIFINANEAGVSSQVSSDPSLFMGTNSSLTNSFGYNNTYMSLSNVHATDSVAVDLYLHTSSKLTESISTPVSDYDTYPEDGIVITEYSIYILKDITIPVNVTLRLDKEDLLFDNSLYELIIQLSASDSAVDVIINTIN